METKKLGFLIIGISLVMGFIIFNFMNTLNLQSHEIQCNPTQECQQINSVLGVSHIAIGLLAFIFALGFYLLFFNKDEKIILEKYHEELEKNNINYNKNLINNQDTNNNKFSMMLKPLDDNERKILVAIKEQEGITQATLRYRADLSKATVSQILTDFEKKNLIERKSKGKTYSVFLTENF